MSTRPSPADVAYHEAGHAVIALKMGAEVRLISARRSGGVHGQVETQTLRIPEDRRPFAIAVICLAALAAEEQFTGARPDNAGANYDRERARQQAAIQEQAAAFYERAESEAARLVARFWEGIAFVADVLVEREEVHAIEVARALWTIYGKRISPYTD